MSKKILFGILTAAAIIIIFLPQILSMPFARPLFENALGKKFDAKISIQTVHLSWFGPQAFQKISFSNPDMTGSIERLESDVPLWSLTKFGNAFVLQNGFFSFPKYDNLSVGPVDAKIAGHALQATGEASQGGRFTVNGKIYSKADFDLVATFNEMPSVPFDQLLKANGLLRASLGPRFDLSATALYTHGEGRIVAALAASNANLTLKGEIAQDTLFLKEPLAITLQFSPELSQALGGRILEAKNPITLQIEKAGASIPLNPFSLERLEIGQATLDLGQIVVAKLPPLISLFTLLKRGSLSTSASSLWLTPMIFSVDKGLLHMGRVDALAAGAIHLCGWGSLDLTNDGLDMRLGIPADTLEQTLGIQNLSRNYVLQIPVRGSLQKPEFDTASAAGKLAAMAVGSEIISKKTGVFGKLLNQFTPTAEDTNVPPPNRPFPWER